MTASYLIDRVNFKPGRPWYHFAGSDFSEDPRDKAQEGLKSKIAFILNTNCRITNTSLAVELQLDRYLKDVKSHLPEHKMIQFIYQISLALDWLHENKILHGDIRCRNVLVFQDAKEGEWNVKLCLGGAGSLIKYTTSNLKEPSHDGYLNRLTEHKRKDCEKIENQDRKSLRGRMKNKNTVEKSVAKIFANETSIYHQPPEIHQHLVDKFKDPPFFGLFCLYSNGAYF